MSLKERLSIGHIANFFGTRLGSMSFDRILSSYGLDDIIPNGNKTERIGFTLQHIYEKERDEFINFLNIIVSRHRINDVDSEELNKYLLTLGLQIEDGRVVEIQPEDEFFNFFEQSLRHPEIIPAEEGESDGAIITVSDRILGASTDFVLIDFGCGKGRLISGLNLLDDRLLSLMTYIGVDKDVSCLHDTETFIKSINFDKKIKEYKLLIVEQFFKEKYLVDFIFMINVLHEINLNILISIIRELECKLRKDGLLLIHEMSELIEGEMRFISWEKEDFEEFFKNTNFRIYLHPYKTRSGIPLINAHLNKVREDLTDEVIYIDNMFDMLKRIMQRIDEEISEIYKSGERHKRFAYLLVLKYNIELQINEYEKKELEQMDERDPFYGTFKCPECGSRNLVRNSIEDNFILGCQRCGWSILSQ